MNIALATIMAFIINAPNNTDFPKPHNNETPRTEIQGLFSTGYLSDSYISERVENKFLIRNEDTVVLNVPFVHQIENLPEDQKNVVRTTACGPAVITMVLNYLGDNQTLINVIETLPTNVYIKGDKFYNLYEGPKYFDKDITKIKNTAAQIYDTLAEGNPIILNLQNYDGITGHAVVVVGITEFDGTNAKALIVHDPFRAPYRKFEYIDQQRLQQPEGYINTIGILEPFYITNT